MSRSALRLVASSPDPEEQPRPVRIGTVKDAAAEWHVSERVVYRLIERRQIPFFRISRAIRLDLDGALAALRQEAER
jgi:hypothetical protein